MHTKREIVCIGLPDAMLIKNAALTKTRMAPSRTALPGIRSVQVLSNLSRRADSLNGAIPILSPKSDQSLGRQPIHILKFVYTGRLYICTMLTRAQNYELQFHAPLLIRSDLFSLYCRGEGNVSMCSLGQCSSQGFLCTEQAAPRTGRNLN